MLPIADGTDMGGSLRNPASFCNVVGLRPSPGRVPTWPCATPWSTLSVRRSDGADVRRRGADAERDSPGPIRESPIALADPGRRFAAPLERSFDGVRVAWWSDLGGVPVDPRVREVVNAQRPVFESLECRVEEAEPDFRGLRRGLQDRSRARVSHGVAPRVGATPRPG